MIKNFPCMCSSEMLAHGILYIATTQEVIDIEQGCPCYGLAGLFRPAIHFYAACDEISVLKTVP
jgi:hypothetical protein